MRKKGSKPNMMDDIGEQIWAYEVLKRFRMIFRAVQLHSQRVETHCGVTSAQLWALWELSKGSGLRVTDLAKVMAIHHSTASNLLDKLAKKGLIARQRVSVDQRVVTVSLTEAGRTLVECAEVPAQGILQHALFNVPDPVLRSLVDGFDVLIGEMKITDDGAALEPLNPLPRRTKKPTSR